ncbi:GNAT family N-acetyltransferase [Aestuariibacter sp. AA17]|uniref:GNAT family N-acetyltransferase n=1 Tax=Fluctibacter corallii TaxID=2984329 RepID=A0ABT3A5H2_9ALTE|nr:GNAT family N-acetyltransferase [Aestuariibacter sp. AA17]MCV2883894.1 GNAT family N-acetyltransferase [Aestuariibacter sp. AA17]
MAFKVLNVDWGSEKHRLSKIRERVFVYEWRIPKDQEFDTLDGVAFHVLLVDDNGNEVATGRITPAGEIGRIAVMPHFRNQEVYQTLFKALLSIAEQCGLTDVSVQCELEGVEYYQQQGFRPVGHVYMDAGVPRQRMLCNLTDFTLKKVELTH